MGTEEGTKEDHRCRSKTRKTGTVSQYKEEEKYTYSSVKEEGKGLKEEDCHSDGKEEEEA